MSDRRPKPGETLPFDFGVFVPAPVAPPPPPVVLAAVVTAPAPLVTAPAPLVTAPAPLVTAPAPLVTAPAGQPPAPEGPRIFTVAQLGKIVSRSLERSFADSIWVEGEVSGARPAASGHLYFALKDEEEDAVVDVVVYRAQITPRARALVKDGVRIRLRGKPTFWSPRGKLQFIGDRIEASPASGKGALLEALEKLKAKLQAEGLFAQERKRPLPHEPRIIGVVTSAGGAVIHDICKVAFRRGGARILLAPAQVQGVGAAEAVRRALGHLQRVAEVDVIIVGRGGGSQDDLLAFHDEQLVRDVAACRVPVVSAVGHETDITLVDFAADARASTPSQAAELVVPDANARRRLLEERALRLRRAVHARITNERARTARVASAFRDPRLLIASAQQSIDENVARLSRIFARRFAQERETHTRLESRLGAAHPRSRITRDTGKVHALNVRLAGAARARVSAEQRLVRDVRRRLEAVNGVRLGEERADLSDLAGRLDAMSPLKVLARGYAIATRAPDGRAVREASEVQPGDRVHVRVGRGAFDAEVTRIEIGEAPAEPAPTSGGPTSRRARRDQGSR